MEKIKVKKEKLISVLKENKIKHIEDYEKAVLGYKINVKKALSVKQKELKNLPLLELGKFNPSLDIFMPTSHENDFDTVIGMLEVCEDTEILINNDEYKQYYLNEWSWKRGWYLSNSANVGIGTSAYTTLYNLPRVGNTKK